MCTLSIITCVYNEDKNIDLYFSSLVPVLENLNVTYEIIFVNDGSTDRTIEKLEALPHLGNVKIVSLSRNFGKEIALTAGFDYSRGSAIMPIDVDLQEPVELIPVFFQKWKEGYLNVIGVRENREYESFVKRNVTKIFYRFISAVSKVRIIPNSSDFRMLDRKVVNEIIKMRESNRFMKGIYAFPGFSFTTVDYCVSKRMNSTSKFNVISLWKLSLDGLFGFSSAAIKIWTYFGSFLICLTLIYTIFIVGKAMIYGIDVPGYITTIILILLFGGTQLIAIGILGEYIARIFEQVKGRPLYVVEKVVGLETENKESKSTCSQF